METKINIKELAKNLKNMNSGVGAPKEESQAVVVVKEPVEAAETKAKVEIPKKTQQDKPIVEKEVIVKPIKEVKTTVTKHRNVTPANTLLTELEADLELYDFSKQVWIDADIYEILVQIKRKKKIKNISILVTSIIENYINQNKDNIKQLFDRKLGK